MNHASWGGVNYAPIPDFPGYLVGDNGTVISLRLKKPITLRFDYNYDGYVRVKLYNKHGAFKMFVHRLVAEAFVPKRDGDKIVDHLDTNVENNAASNLRWCRDMRENLQNPLTIEKRKSGIRHFNPKSKQGRLYERLKLAEMDAAKHCPF